MSTPLRDAHESRIIYSMLQFLHEIEILCGKLYENVFSLVVQEVIKSGKLPP